MVDKIRPVRRGSDAIDQFTNDILRHPEQADRLKANLRQSLGVAAANLAGPGVARDRASSVPDLEDFWDNVPV